MGLTSSTRADILERTTQNVQHRAFIATEYAGFWRRLAAFLIDEVVLCILYLPLSLISPAFLYPILKLGVPQSSKASLSYHSSIIQHQVSAALSVFLIALLASLVILLTVGYFVILTYRKGGTLGKLLLHLKVVDRHRNRISLQTALLRYTVGYATSSFGGLGFLWIALDGRKQGWHDKIAGTFVVREKRTRNYNLEYEGPSSSSGSCRPPPFPSSESSRLSTSLPI